MKSYEHILTWKAIGQNQTTEKLRISTIKQNTKMVNSEIKGLKHGHPFHIKYIIDLTSDWRVRKIQIKSLLNKEPIIWLRSDLNGSWFSRKGKKLIGLNNCIDIDISATPFTNTLPINRLSQKLKERTRIDVVYFDLDEWNFRNTQQYYTHISKNLYRYENIETDYNAEIPTDSEGYVINYPGLFNRITDI